MDARILADLGTSYALACTRTAPVSGGYLNKKYKASAAGRDFLIKQFSFERYSNKGLVRIEIAMQRQMLLHKMGVCCPEVLTHEGRAIRFVDDETAYMVMEFRQGQQGSPDAVTLLQMRSLGAAAAAMHKALSQLPVESADLAALDGQRTLDKLWENFNARASQCAQERDVTAQYKQAVGALEPVLRQITPDFFDAAPKGLAHEDFSADNLLFAHDRLSAIVDFDRCCYSFVWHDVGRALMSLAFQADGLNLPRINAFIGGYCEHLPLTLENVAHALRLTWCIEVPWWIQDEFFRSTTPKTVRFRDEMLWLTRHFNQLDRLLGL